MKCLHEIAGACSPNILMHWLVLLITHFSNCHAFIIGQWGLILCVCVYVCARALLLQVITEMSVDTKPQTLQGLAFPLQAEAKHALQQLARKHVNYIQLVRPA